MIVSWKDWFLANNAAGAGEKYSPDTNPYHLIKSEVADVYKAMGKIRALEARLKSFDMNSGETNEDFKMLNSLKRELGIPVEFADEKTRLQGDGKIPPKAVVATQ